MPIYSPTLPPRVDAAQGDAPALVLARFDLRRIWRQKLGLFFRFVFIATLLIEIAILYFRHLVYTNPALGQVQSFASAALPQGPAYQAGHLDEFVQIPLWFMMATVCGGLVARDTLFRIRPLVYAHPVRQRDYVLAKLGLAVAIPLAVMLPFVLVPWILSLMLAGAAGPVWPTLPLYLLPAALMVSLLMAAASLGGSAMASTPRAGVSWVLGYLFGSSALGGILVAVLHEQAFQALSPILLTSMWPRVICGAPALFGWGPLLTGTAFHLALGLTLLLRSTRPDEAVL